MKYQKPPLSFHDQAKLLIERGVIATQEDMEQFLSRVNYYRFSGYLYPYRSGDGENYSPGTSLEVLENIYRFDTALRLLTLSALEVIEITILRTQMVEKFSLLYGAFCYTDHRNYRSSLPRTDHNKMMDKIITNVNRSNEEFVNLYRNKYDSEDYFPFWMVAEAITFGQLSIIFRNLPHNVQVPIAKHYNLHSRVMVSWLHTLSTIRNICAHHSRLWNRVLPVKPAIPSRKYHPEFYGPNRIRNDKYFIVLGMLKYLLDIIIPENSLIGDFTNLLSAYHNVPIHNMGFPEDWREYHLLQ